MPGRKVSVSIAALLATSMFATQAGAACFRGINLAGAEFGELGSPYGKGYVYPSENTVAYFADKGFNTVRLPFRWERLQPILGDELDANELQRIHDAVDLMRARGLNVILDVHNYARFNGQVIGDRISGSDFADLWSRLASEFANADGVSFGIMNEPFDIDTMIWLAAANAAVSAIREAGAKNLVLVPGTSWTGAFSWFSDERGGSNAETMIRVQDPADNLAFEVHQYLDSNFSGTHETCERAEDALQALKNFTAWLRENGKRGFLGEFGGSNEPACVAGLKAMVDYMNAEKDVWTGWTYWAGGDWWPASEAMNIQPVDGKDRPQLKALLGSGLEDRACAGL